MSKLKSVNDRIDYTRIVPASHLFLGNKIVEVEEEGLTYSYNHTDCFLGNVELGSDYLVNLATFMLKQLTGEGAGEMHFPINLNDSFYIVRMIENGEDECYKILADEISFGKKHKDFYQIKDIVKYIETLNNEAKLSAKTITENNVESSQKAQ